ncbi:MAG: hypothetical protein HOH98_04455 [Flavobacteriaceae bacterium]|nr:hypothetical protein [Flavobacteriaceae bacterium]
MKLKIISNFLKSNFPLGIILFAHLPFFIFGKSSYIEILDNLNCEFIFNHLLAVSDNIFNINQFDKIDNVINGWGLLYIHSQFKILKLLFLLFDPFYAYVFKSLLVRIIGYFGMKLLFKELYPTLKHKEIIFITFALLPGMVIFGSCLWGLPLLLWSFIKLKNEIKFTYIFAIILYVISSTPYQYPFISLALIVYIGYLFFRDKKLNKGILLGFIVFNFLGILLDFGLLVSSVTSYPELISHRTKEISNVLYPSINGVFYQYFKILIFGEFNPSHFFSLPIIILFLVNIYKFGIKFNSLKLRYFLLILFVISLKILTPYIIALDLPLVSNFGFDRKILYFVPLLFFLLLGELLKYKYSNSLVFVILFSLLFTNLFRNIEITYNLLPKQIAHAFVSEDEFFKNKLFKNSSKSRFLDVDEFSNLNYDKYFSESLFDEISAYINTDKKNYRIINLGISPSVTLFNGFYNLDGYLSNHPKVYNHKFDKIQTNYSVKNQHKLRLKYQGYNNICNNCIKSDPISKLELDINIKSLLDLNCSYIFSAFQITNYKKLKLNFINKFENNDSPYNVYLYKL